MNAKQKTRIVYALALLLVLVIIGYNVWSYLAGYCTISTLLAFSLPAKLLLVGILVASVRIGFEQTFAADYLEPHWIFLVSLIAIDIVLFIRPSGLFCH